MLATHSRSSIKWVTLIALSAVAFYAVTRIVFSLDDRMPGIRSFVEANAEIAAQTGDVHEIHVLSRTSVSTSVNSPAHRIYTLSVTGSVGKAIAVIREEDGRLSLKDLSR